MKKSENMPVLAQENGFGSAQLPSLRLLVKGTATVFIWRKQCTKYNLTDDQCL
jgi:hypothetical protein